MTITRTLSADRVFRIKHGAVVLLCVLGGHATACLASDGLQENSSSTPIEIVSRISEDLLKKSGGNNENIKINAPRSSARKDGNVGGESGALTVAGSNLFNDLKLEGTGSLANATMTESVSSNRMSTIQSDMSMLIASQRGDNNVIQVSQSGRDNVARLDQTGSYNTISGVQSGSANSATITQSGLKQTVGYIQSGNGSTLTIRQR